MPKNKSQEEALNQKKENPNPQRPFTVASPMEKP